MYFLHTNKEGDQAVWTDGVRPNHLKMQVTVNNEEKKRVV